MDTLGHWSVISGHVSASSVRAPSIQTVIVHTATGWYAHTRGALSVAARHCDASTSNILRVCQRDYCGMWHITSRPK